MTDDEHPFIKTLPPAMDYVNYLIVVEHNLTIDSLQTLHKVLQDEKLTINIGWDLVHTLLPLLPHSSDCLQDISRLGNPREVILKVTEALRLLDFEQEDDRSEADSDPGRAMESLKISQQDLKEELLSPATREHLEKPLKVMKFQALLNMLSILHPRIKTKLPSRFLATSLQAVLSCYTSAESHLDELTASTVKFVKTISGTRRPHLPPRTSSSMVPKASAQQVAPDPEAQNEPVSPQEQAIQSRLMQSFITHVIEEYLESFTSEDDAPGLSWSSRLMEKQHPERNIPQRKTFAQKYANEEHLQARSSITGQLVALAQDLRLDSTELLEVITSSQADATISLIDEDEPPATPEDIPLSRIGALYIFTARSVSEVSYNARSQNPPTPIFPTHSTLITNFLNTKDPQTIGQEPEATIDAIIALALIALEANLMGDLPEDEQYSQYIQTLSLLSANAPSPSLRYHAHYISTTVLRSHPSDVYRLSHIRDTLEHCPYSNLKTSALGWLKGEIVDANVPPSITQHGTSSSNDTAATVSAAVEHLKSPKNNTDRDAADDDDDHHSSIFATPVALTSTAPFVFPDIAHDTDLLSDDAPSTQVAMHYKLEASFYLAALNFYYLLLSAGHLHDAIEVEEYVSGGVVYERFLGGLRQVEKRLQKAVEDLDGDEEVKADTMLLNAVLGRVEESEKKLKSVS